ncbi:sulfatase [Martelella endophytica]|uniref:Sulfatase n=1 Tax=Martelella endophytica TaxID=1486262 RepID=A0A0D5LUH4_MAREN|nr:sulfatase [Martelella endophytica]AJY47874.1 sulfatase [Martelella endophytica]
MRSVLVLFDSLNRLALECYGGSLIATPNFNRLAARGVTFDSHYVGSLPCMPARRDMHTGRLSFMHRSWGPLEPFDNSMPELLKDAGVYTHLITDHFHYFEDGGATYHPRYSTWEFVRGQEYDAWKAKVKPPLERYRRDYSDRNYNGPKQANRLQHQVNRDFILKEEDFPAYQCFEKAFAFLDENRDADNWMLQLECFDPHEPFFAPKRFRDKVPTDYDGPILDWPQYVAVTESPEEIAEVRANYAALVAMCDEYLGKLLDYFDEHDLWKDTSLILTTDHGFLLSEHDWWGKNVTPYYEEIAHIPLIMHHPDLADRQGTRVYALTQTPDLMPTMLDVFSQPIPPETTGLSLFERMAGRPGDREVIFGMFGGPIGVTDGDYSYFLYPPDLGDESLREYTIMPTHLKSLFGIDELRTATMHPPMDFTKGVPVFSIAALTSARRPPGEYRKAFTGFETALYDLRQDPEQQQPIRDQAVEARLREAILGHLARHDATETFMNWMGLAVEEAAPSFKRR